VSTHRRCVLVLLLPPRWTPPGIDPYGWRSALAEDVVDMLATLAEVEPAIATTAADRALAAEIAWPGMPIYEVPRASPADALAAAGADGYTEAAVLPADVPDLPGLLIGKLLRPLTTRGVAAAPAYDGGLLGIAARLPAPGWLADLDLDAHDLAALRAAAPGAGAVASAPGWHRQRGPLDLTRLDPGLEGWAATRALLTDGRRATPPS
jgi:hypothetical protein